MYINKKRVLIGKLVKIKYSPATVIVKSSISKIILNIHWYFLLGRKSLIQNLSQDIYGIQNSNNFRGKGYGNDSSFNFNYFFSIIKFSIFTTKKWNSYKSSCWFKWWIYSICVSFSDDEKSVLITTSDKEGKFIISKDKLKNSFVVISHSNFKDLKVSYENLNLNKTIKLDKKIYYFDPIFVIGNKYNFESNNLPVKHIIINSVDFPSHGNSLGEKLDRFGLSIKDYGGTSGLKTIASQTGFSEHVLVMVDGFEINSPQNGVVDLSTFPGDLFSHAEYYNGQGSSIYGSNAIGGVINLIPSSKSNFIKQIFVSFGLDNGRVSLHITCPRTKLIAFKR